LREAEVGGIDVEMLANGRSQLRVRHSLVERKVELGILLRVVDVFGAELDFYPVQEVVVEFAQLNDTISKGREAEGVRI
jgi:hypothetical protein